MAEPREQPEQAPPAVIRKIIHVDMDAFYASVEQLLDPRLRGKPIAVGGGVVLAASYEARAFGVRSGMPGRRARQLCFDLVFVGGHFDEYQRLGDAAIGVLSDFTPSIERILIPSVLLRMLGKRLCVWSKAQFNLPPQAVTLHIFRRLGMI